MRWRVSLVALLWAGAGSAGELRVGGQYAGHLLFTDVLGAEVEWPAVQRRDRLFLHEVDLATGVAMSSDGEFFAVPAIVRVELLHRWNVGVDVGAGTLVTHFEGSTALTGMVCAGLPFTYQRLRVRTELCANASAGPPGGINGGLWTGLGIGAFYAF